MRNLPLAILVLLVPFAAVATADILILEGGGRVEGVVTEGLDSYTVRSVHGTAVVSKSKVMRRIEIRYITEIYEDRRRGVDASDADEQFRLSLWCERNGLRKRARRHLDQVVSLNPDHEKARAKLGFVRFRGTWMAAEEANSARMSAAGFVEFEGRWFTEAGLEAYVRAKGEMALLAEKQAAKEEERRAADRKARLEEERIAREAAERRAAELALQRAEEDRKARERLEAENRALRDLLNDLGRRGYLGWGSYYYLSPYYVVPGTVGRLGRRGLSGFGTGLEFRYSKGKLHIRGRVR